MVFHKWIFRFFDDQSYNLRRSINGAIIVLARDPWTLTARSEDQVVGPLSPGFKYEMFKFNETSGCTNIRQIPRKEFFFSKNIYGFFSKVYFLFQWTLNKYNIRQCVNETL